MTPFDEPIRALLRGEESVWPAGEFDLEQFVAHVSDNGIAPLVHSNRERARNWPEFVLEALRTEALRAAATEPFRLADLREVIESVDALIVKGSALAYSLCASPDLRPRGDTDLLVADAGVARRTFVRLGFRERMTSGDELAFRQTTFVRRDAHGLEHLYDVHWAIANTPLFADVLRFDELSARAVALPRV